MNFRIGDTVSSPSVFNVKSYGALGTGTGDDTSAITSAIAAMPNGGVLFFPVGRYPITSISTTKAINIRGEGVAGSSSLDVFGASYWGTPDQTGAIIESSISSGTIVALESGGNRNVSVENIVIKGIGNASRTVVGLSLQNGRAKLSDVVVLNCAIGIKTDNIEDSTFIAPQLRGCATGLNFTNNSNSNAIIGVDASANNISIEIDGTSSDWQFLGGTIQGSQQYGIHGNVEGCLIDGVYFENSAATAAIHATSGSASDIIRCPQSTAGDVFNIGGNEHYLRLHKYTRPVNFLAGSFHNQCWTGGGVPVGSVDSGTDNHFLSVTDYGVEYHVPSTGAMFLSTMGGHVTGFLASTAGGLNTAFESIDDLGFTRIVDTNLNQGIITLKGNASGPMMGLWGANPVLKPTITGVNNTALDSLFAQFATAGLCTAPTKPSTGTVAPTIGTWARGDIVYNSSPTPGSNIGWVCTTAGTPGIWNAFGGISL